MVTDPIEEQKEEAHDMLFRSFDETKKEWSEEHSADSNSDDSSDSDHGLYQNPLADSNNNWEMRSKDIKSQAHVSNQLKKKQQ